MNSLVFFPYRNHESRDLITLSNTHITHKHIIIPKSWENNSSLSFEYILLATASLNWLGSLEPAVVQASWGEPQSNWSLKTGSWHDIHKSHMGICAATTTLTSWQVKSDQLNADKSSISTQEGGIDDATMQPDELQSSPQLFFGWNPQRPT